MRFWKARNGHFRLPRWGPACVLICGLATCGSHGASARELTDHSGAKLSLADHPVRVIALAPSLAELAADFAGARLEHIVGVSEFSDYPPGLKKISSIGPYFRFNLERVAALKPDLVLATTDGNPKDEVLHLRELGLPVVVVNTGSMKQVADSMRLVGEAMGERDHGIQMAAQLERGIARFKLRGTQRAPRSVFLEIGDEPLVTVAKGTFLNEAIETLGARNVFASEPRAYPKPSWEVVLSHDPECVVILALDHSSQQFLTRAETRWARFHGLKAVQAKRVRGLVADTLLRPTLRLLEGLAALDRAIYE